MSNASVDFFDAQFQRQVREHDLVLNPFERLAMDYLKGSILDLGCGLGNLSLEAARRGHPVVAVDASAAAIQRIRAEAATQALPLRAIQADAGSWSFEESYDTVVCIGLLMFFCEMQALRLLDALQASVKPGGRAVVNALIEGTTFMRMFERGHYHLFGADEIEHRFAGWTILVSCRDARPAPEGTRKVFTTVIAERPARLL